MDRYRPILSMTLAVLAAFAALPAAAQAPAEDALRRTLDLERRLVLEDLAALERARTAEAQARTRLDEVLAQVQAVARGTVAGSGAAVNNLERLEPRLETAAADLAAAGRRASGALARLEERVQRLRLLAVMVGAGEVPPVADVLTGTWQVTVDPGARPGVFELRQDATLVTGTYRMQDGRRGSLRGTFVDGVVKLDRVDAERGFESTFEGELAAGAQAIAGEWTATELADGDVSGGEWAAVKAGSAP